MAGVIQARWLILAGLALLGAGLAADSPDEARLPASEGDLRSWLENMVWHHRFSDQEIAASTGMPLEKIPSTRKRLSITGQTRPSSIGSGTVRLMPYPGGRHPRIGFLEGAIHPQRETKVSLFTPWGDGSEYVVVDVPEALWSNLGLTYLAHTHIDTIWTVEGVPLPRLEWNVEPGGALTLTRNLPNGISYRAIVRLVRDHLEMELTLTNGTDGTLTDLRVQNCIMLKGAPSFAALTNDNKVFEAPFAAVQSAENRQRWIITAWEPCHRPWGNARVPCLHSDPRFPDCGPGDTRVVRGWVSFYEGDELRSEFDRIRRSFFSLEE